MNIHRQDPQITVWHADCLNVLAEMPDNSVDAIVTDPPYGLGFMGKAWDDLPPGLPWAQECLRVIKPGGHLLAFGGTRTWHRLAGAVEDAGFEVRDSIAWLYGSGFPKSLDVSKAIDKGSGKNRERQLQFTAWMRSTGITGAQINEATGTNMGCHYLTDASQPAIATADLFDRLRPLLPEVPEAIERLVAERTGIAWTDYVKRPITQAAKEALRPGDVISFDQRSSTDRERRDIPATPAAQQWAGWGTALKPAFEPIVVARKPLAGTVAANVLAHGVGALNIDGTRVGIEETRSGPTVGRWPTNVVLDDHAAAELDATGPHTKSAVGPTVYPQRRGRAAMTAPRATAPDLGHRKVEVEGYGDSGGASRFFPTFRYQAKAPTRERPKVGGVSHPTCKPLTLMRWLVRLVCPPGGTVLDPFAGSGTTTEACILEGFNCITVEREADYLPLIDQRIERARHTTTATNPTLFNDENAS